MSNEFKNELPPVEDKGLGMCSFAFGILSMVFFCFKYVSIGFSALSVLLAAICLIKNKPGKGFAIIGVILSLLSLLTVYLLYSGILQEFLWGKNGFSLI